MRKTATHTHLLKKNTLRKLPIDQGMVTYACKASSQEAQTGSEVQGQQGGGAGEIREILQTKFYFHQFLY